VVVRIEGLAKSNFCLNNSKELKQQKCTTKRCTRQPAPTAERNVKFPSNQTALGQCTAENVTLNEDPHEDIKLTS